VLQDRATFTVWHEQDTLEPGREFVRESLRWGCRVLLSTGVVRTQAHPREGFRASDAPISDLRYWMRLGLDWDVGFLVAPTVDWRVHFGTLSAGLGVPGPYGYERDDSIVLAARSLKRQFLADHRDRFHDAAELERVIDRGTRWDLVNSIRTATWPGRDRRTTMTRLWKAARLDRGLWMEPEAWRLLLASAIGPRLTDGLKRLRG
jgi:hypothetical protein